MTSSFPTPKLIKGGCLCGALRYQVDFPADHDFKASSSTCQCTQCRKQTAGLYLVSHKVPLTAFKLTTGDGDDDTSTLKDFRASPTAERGFCTACGSLLYWRPIGGSYTCFTIGTVDPLYLTGQGEGGGSETGGYGLALASGEGYHYWCSNEIPGVTDGGVPLLGPGKGHKVPKD
ncbi:Mss4-like protein [Lasiosphaeria ovina]|uniref:Mss4-like protein n=1 Tax=Lasiosphaeria ovina TaxID=92902 RepID=A0AAE0KN60_9PEZI|nr:Mss4-like protein [Lasiosphaeria ovina]